ncbi:hypothetical protein Hamer_G002105, partial [Homarus americanus]
RLGRCCGLRLSICLHRRPEVIKAILWTSEIESERVDVTCFRVQGRPLNNLKKRIDSRPPHPMSGPGRVRRPDLALVMTPAGRVDPLHRLPANKELINDMIVPLLHQWTKANALFKPPVINQCRTIELKLTKLWHKAVETSLGKGNLARKNEFLHTLDTLFDILTCKCSIQLCSESNCSHSGKRENNSHIDCGCPREKKIPVLELEFIKAQRTKAEGQRSMQMGSIDYSETKKQIANAKKREQIREREQKKKMKSEEAIQREEELCQDVYHFFDIPPINVNATKLSELVDLSLEVLEPPLTTSLTSQELRNLKETPMQVPKWPSHTQSVERCVKMVTEAAGHVYSHERREETFSPFSSSPLIIRCLFLVFSLPLPAVSLQFKCRILLQRSLVPSLIKSRPIREQNRDQLDVLLIPVKRPYVRVFQVVKGVHKSRKSFRSQVDKRLNSLVWVSGAAEYCSEDLRLVV